MNTVVNFELAKLLKEKRFNLKVKQRWSVVENIDGNKSSFCQYDCGLFNWNSKKYHEFSSAPTIAEVVMWLYEKHGIWINVDAGVNGFYGHYKINPIGTLSSNLKQSWVNTEENPYKLPTEAYIAAIEYVLKNLI